MENTFQNIEKKDYDLIGILNDEQDCLEELVGKSGYICDAISETADGFIPICNSDIWENVSSIQGYIEEAIGQGLAPVEPVKGNVDLIKIFQAGYYQYYTESLYNNLDVMAFNLIADKVNEALDNLDEETINVINIEAITEEIESEVDGYDHNNTFDNLEEIAKNIVDRINEGEFAK